MCGPDGGKHKGQKVDAGEMNGVRSQEKLQPEANQVLKYECVAVQEISPKILTLNLSPQKDIT